MEDDFSARDATAITPSDTVALAPIPMRVLVGGAGNIVGRAMSSSADVTFAVVAGQELRVRLQFIRATGTTATGLVALY